MKGKPKARMYYPTTVFLTGHLYLIGVWLGGDGRIITTIKTHVLKKIY